MLRSTLLSLLRTQRGLLGKWDTRALPPGDYDVRLVVVDQAGQFSVPTQVTIHVK